MSWVLEDFLLLNNSVLLVVKNVLNVNSDAQCPYRQVIRGGFIYFFLILLGICEISNFAIEPAAPLYLFTTVM